MEGIVTRGLAYWKKNGTRQFLRGLAVWLKVRAKYLSVGGPALDGNSTPLATQMAAAPSLVFDSPHLVIIADLNLPQCRKYRVLQKVEYFASQGFQCSVASYTDGFKVLSLMQLATAVVFYRVPASQELNIYLFEVNRLCLPKYYDIDDPIFSEKVYGGNLNLQHLSDFEQRNLISSADSYATAMKNFDKFIVSTPGLAALVSSQFSGDAYVWRNLLDSESIYSYESTLAHQPSKKPLITIVYASGSRAHEEDFKLVEGALLKALDYRPDVQLLVLGYSELSPEFGTFESRLVRKPFRGFAEYISDLASADICVIPLLADEFNECKSAIRFMESSLVAVPAVVSAVGDFNNVVEQGVNGMLANGPEDFWNSIKLLIDDPGLRNRLGSSAQQSVTNNLNMRDGKIKPEHIDPALLEALLEA